MKATISLDSILTFLHSLSLSASNKRWLAEKRFVIFAWLVFVICSSVAAQTNLPNKAQRVYTLSTLWKELEYNFAFPDHLKRANLDSLYLAYLPKIEDVEDEYEYYRTLSAFMAHFNEAHTRILPPSKLPYDMPPLLTSNIGEHIYVKNVAHEFQKDIPLNSEIISVNHIPVMEYLTSQVYPYVGAATAHWKRDKAVTEMLYGRPQTEVVLTIRTQEGTQHDVSMRRNYYANNAAAVMADTISVPPLEVKYLADSIGYLHFTTCNGNRLEDIQNTFYQHMERLAQCKGLIVDIRGNRGGTDQAWYLIAYCSMPGKEFNNKGKWITRKHIAAYKNYGYQDNSLKEYYEGKAMEVLHHPPYRNGVPDSLKFKQPMVVLSGQYVGSAAEDFVMIMKENKRAIIVGEPTVGCIGEPMFVDLPGGYTAMISAKAYLSEDGTQPNETGILPDIEVRQDYASHLQGKDYQLDSAIKIVSSMEKSDSINCQ